MRRQGHIQKGVDRGISDEKHGQGRIMTPLYELALMSFDELSRFVSKTTNGEKYIANPQEASDTDLDICCEYVVNTVLMPALKNNHKRADSRSLKVGENDVKTAELIASCALTYWQNHGFIIAQNSKLNRSISAKIKEEERAEAKREMIALQMGTIGAIVRAQKTHKKGTLQACWDFEESECVFNKMSSGGLEFGDATTAFVSF